MCVCVCVRVREVYVIQSTLLLWCFVLIVLFLRSGRNAEGFVLFRGGGGVIREYRDEWMGCYRL